MDPGTAEAFRSAREHLRPLLGDAMSLGRTIAAGPVGSDGGVGNGSDYYKEKYFLRSGVAREILSEEHLTEMVLGFVIHRHIGPTQDERDLRRIRGSPGLCAILLNILAFGRPEMIPLFETSFLEEPLQCRKTDDDLPFDEHFAKQLFGAENGRVFFEKQFAFVAITLGEGLFHREYQALRCLPYLEDERIGRGAYGRVYRVRIEKEHFLFKEPRSRNSDTVLLARKDFDSDAASYKAFEDEDRTLSELVNSSNCPSNIMTSICSIVCAIPNTDLKLGSIFFPAALCDLNDYINDDTNRPLHHRGRLHHIRQMLGVCQALEWLARNLTYKKDSDQYIQKTYYHCDLKPDNILVYRDPAASDDDRGELIFKISDFGQARELQHVIQDEGNRRAHLPPGVELVRREGTYRAPEIQGRDVRLEVKPQSDVWSFGCIFLLIIIFNYDGAVAIEQFSLARRRESFMRSGDHFYHDPEARSGDIANPAVTQHLNAYIKRRATSELDHTITVESLEYLKDKILVRHGKRHDIARVSNKLHSLYNRRPPVTPDETLHRHVPNDAVHCGHSPDGLAFYYSPSKVTFCDHEGVMGADITLWPNSVRPRSTSCTGAALCIVSESHGNLNCIFQSITTPPPQPPLHMILRDVKTPVDRVACSPNGQMLAIAGRPNTSSQARIRLYQLDDLERPEPRPVHRLEHRPEHRAEHRAELFQYRTSGSSSVTNSTNNSDPPDHLGRGGTGRIQMVQSVVDLCFSGDGNVLYYACRMAHEGKPRVRVCMWNTATYDAIAECIIKDTDTTHQFPFLTSITPFNKQVGFLCITHQRSIVKRTMHENRMHEQVIKVHDAKCLRTVIISSNDEKVVILATPDGSTVEIYGGLLSDIGASRKLAISTKIKYDPKEDTAYIRESGGVMRVCITSLRNKKTYAFDLARLFDL